MSEEMVSYDNRLVPKKWFRVFVYDKNNNEKLANNYEEFTKLVSSGLWFVKKQTKEKQVDMHPAKRGKLNDNR